MFKKICYFVTRQNQKKNNVLQLPKRKSTKQNGYSFPKHSTKTTSMKKILLLLFSFVCIVSASFGQAISVNTSLYTVEELVQDVLINGCVTASNIQVSGGNAGIGYFSCSNPSFPFSSGIVMASGDISNAVGPNNETGAGSQLDGNGDPDLLQIITPYSVKDAVILEFDFVPSSDFIQFRYIFGSEEYPEYVCSYNDVFAFFISGPGISGPYSNNAKNIALVPGTTTPVSIDNVNNGLNNNPNDWTCPAQNSAYYVNNNGGQIIEYDGHTVALTATTTVIPCETYHIKLAIADANDQVLDSGVFLEAGSFSSGGQVSMNNPDPVYGSNNDLYEGCQNYYVFSRLDTTDTSSDLPVELIVGGNAQQGNNPGAGDDITPFDTSFIIPAGQIYDTIWYTAFADGVNEGTEYITINLTSGCPCDLSQVVDTIFIYDEIEFKASLTNTDVTYCGDNAPTSVLLTARCSSHPPDFTLYQWSTGLTEMGTGIVNANGSKSEEMVYPTIGINTYFVTISDLCGNVKVDSVNIIISDMLPPTITSSDDLNNTCNGSISLSTNNGFSPFEYYWWYNNTFQSPYTNQSSVSGLCAGNYKILVRDAVGCIDTSIVQLYVVSSPDANFQASPTHVLEGTTVNYTDLSNYAPTSWSWSFPGGVPTTSTAQNPSVLYSTQGSYDATLIATNQYGADTLTKLSYIVVSQETPPTADFIADEDTVIEGTLVTFTDLSTNNPQSRKWIFEGGVPVAAYNTINPTSTYYNEGQYDVTLIVNNNFGYDTLIKSNYITVLPAPDPPVADFSSTKPNGCINDSVFFVNSSLNNPTSFEWQFQDGTPATSTEENPSVLWVIPGNYNVKLLVSNSAGTDTINKVMAVGSIPVAHISPYATRCGEASGSAAAWGTSGNAPYSYEWSTGETADSIFALNVGIITLSITDSYGCKDEVTETILDDGTVTGNITSTNVTCYGGVDGTASISAQNGTEPYTYAWSDGSSTALVSNANAGMYYVTVMDADQCAFASYVEITEPDPVEVTLTPNQTSDTTAEDGAITVNIENGNGPYTLVWSNGTTLTSTSITGLSYGDYSVTVTDNHGCTAVGSASISVGINEFAPLEGVSIYPNPSSGIFTLDLGNNRIKEARIIDITGKTVRLINRPDQVSEIDIRNLANGIYILNLTERKQTYSYRITLKK